MGTGEHTMKGLASEYKKVNNRIDLLLIFNKVLVFQRPHLQRQEARITEITAEIQALTEGFFFDKNVRDDFERKLGPLRTACHANDLKKEDLRSMLDIWIRILHEECRKNWNVSSASMIKDKIDGIMDAMN